jgi:hypothetical protein
MEDYMTRQQPARRRGSRAECAGLDTPSRSCGPVSAAPIQSCSRDIPRPRPKRRGLLLRESFPRRYRGHGRCVVTHGTHVLYRTYLRYRQYLRRYTCMQGEITGIKYRHEQRTISSPERLCRTLSIEWTYACGELRRKTLRARRIRADIHPRRQIRHRLPAQAIHRIAICCLVHGTGFQANHRMASASNRVCFSEPTKKI